MPDTNQLPEPDLGYIKTDISNQPAFSARQMREAVEQALQARAPVQGDPSWWMRETDEGAEWTDTAPLVLSGWTPLYTAPQPAQATQAYVTDEFLYELWEQKYRSWIGGEQFEQIARAILDLRPERVPMSEIGIEDDDSLRFVQRVLESDAPKEDRQSARDMVAGLRKRVRKAHHGITAQATQAEVTDGIRPEDFTVDVVVKPMGGFAPANTQGVRVTHKPTGISVTCDAARSQHTNRQQAFEKLSAVIAPRPERVAMTDEQIRSMCKQEWVFETVKQWVRIIEAHHGITAQAKKETT